MTTDKILDKLSKLKACREGEAAIGNTAAAEAFAGMINSLLLKHELSEVDIPTSGVRTEEEPIIEHLVNPREHGYKFSRVRIGWQEALARVVAPAHLCKFLVSRGTNYITFVGTKSHVAVAEYAYVVLVRAADEMSIKARDAYWAQHRNDPDFESGNFRAAWLQGFIERIAQRFREIRAQEVAQAVSSSTALMRLDQALVRAAKHVEDKYKTKAPSASMGSGCLQGRLEGRKAADSMAIGRQGVGSGAGRKQIR